jgi:hypothetical protein
MGIKGIFEAWKTTGSDILEGRIDATSAKAVGASIFIRNSWQQFKICHHDNWGDDRFPWKLHENRPVGSRRGAVDNWISVDEFPSLKEARSTVIKKLRTGRILAR